MSAMVTTQINGLHEDVDENPGGSPFRAANGRLIRLTVAPAPPKQHILSVGFQSPDGRSWNAIGGGTTVAEAIAFARESCPDDATWELVSWKDLYGE